MDDTLNSTNGDGHSGQFSQRTISAAGAPPAAAPGAFASPFAMGRHFAEKAGVDLDAEVPERPATRPSAAPRPQPSAAASPPPAGTLVDRARQTLDACGPLSVEKLAEALGEDLEKVRTLVRNGVHLKYWTRSRDDAGNKVIVLSPPARARVPKEGERGFKAWLARQGQASEEAPRRGPKPAGKRKPGRKAAAAARKPTARAAKEPGRPITTKTARKAAVKAASTRVAAPTRSAGVLALVPSVPANEIGSGLSCGLFNTGHLHIEVADKGLVLNKAQARDLVAYLDRIASAIQE